MNTLTRLVLIPEDEFFRLKNRRVNFTDRIINSNLPDSMKVALSNEIDHLKVETKNKNIPSNVNAVEIPSNLLEHMEEPEPVEAEEKEEEETKHETQQEDNDDVIMRETKSAAKSPKSPKVEKMNELKLILRSMDFLVNADGEILNEQKRPIINSDIDKVVEFFSKKLAKKRPIGLKRVLAVIKEQNIPITNLINNKSIKDSLTRKESSTSKIKEPTWKILSRSF